jgi:hypothetical protein
MRKKSVKMHDQLLSIFNINDHPSLPLIRALRTAAFKLQNSSHYQWGHMGSCNCGFLAQEITHLDKAEIHRRAMVGSGDWTEQLRDYCPTSGLPMDNLISELIDFGFDRDDLAHLERLSNQLILSGVPVNAGQLCFNLKEHVVLYMRTWADLLEDTLIAATTTGCEESLERSISEQIT